LNIKLKLLNVQFRRSLQRIDLTSQISFFHGQISTGKSSIARLIDYCLGGSLHSTYALNQELVSVQLNAQIGDNDVLLEREGLKAPVVRVTWRDGLGAGASVLAPSQAGAAAIWGSDVYNLSDLIFHLAGITPIKVRRSRRDPESQLVRLSFRDVMWYCYLEQEHLDSSFFRLEDDSRKYKSRDVMRFIVGFYTERMNELEIELERATEERRSKEEAAKQIRAFLEELDYGSDLQIEGQIRDVSAALTASRAALVSSREHHSLDTHFADDLRVRLTELARTVDVERQALADLQSRIAEQEQLRAELLTAKFKLSRAQAATIVLEGVEFERCPSCGTPTSVLERDSQQCILCGTVPSISNEEQKPEILNRDLDSRIDDLESSLRQHRRAVARQERRVSTLVLEKAALDRRLSDELSTYDSAFLSNAREAERQVAGLEEQLRNLQKIARMPESLERLRKEVASLEVKERTLREQIAAEKQKLRSADSVVTEIEDTYRDILVDVGVPGVNRSDSVIIDRTTWVPTIYPQGDEEHGYDFYSAGSGGKKTLLNVCYALAVHRVAAERQMPLPKLLIIDSPMKNIGKDVNKQTFLSLYRVLYGLAKGPLNSTQFVIIDNEFAPPPDGTIIMQRYMAINDPAAPPLVPDYHGA
jgi:predicted DNA-binding protein YlxM (UPF0122 family)